MGLKVQYRLYLVYWDRQFDISQPIAINLIEVDIVLEERGGNPLL